MRISFPDIHHHHSVMAMEFGGTKPCSFAAMVGIHLTFRSSIMAGLPCGCDWHSIFVVCSGDIDDLLDKDVRYEREF